MPKPFAGRDPFANVVRVVIICTKRRRHAPQRSSGSATLEPPSEPPAEGMRLHVVPVRQEALDGTNEVRGPWEGRVLEDSTSDDAEPDLHLIDPGGVQRGEEESEAPAVPADEGLPRVAAVNVQVVPDHGDVAGRVHSCDPLHEAHQIDSLPGYRALAYDVASVRVE